MLLNLYRKKNAEDQGPPTTTRLPWRDGEGILAYFVYNFLGFDLVSTSLIQLQPKKLDRLRPSNAEEVGLANVGVRLDAVEPRAANCKDFYQSNSNMDNRDGKRTLEGLVRVVERVEEAVDADFREDFGRSRQPRASWRK